MKQISEIWYQNIPPRVEVFLRRAVSDLLPTANLLEFAAVGQVNLCGHYRCVLVFVIGGWAVCGVLVTKLCSQMSLTSH
ncbi:hypothetical protein CISIN_1g034927mg [Citrus sinensis]|uniref:Uncharacterized protein n=1 Tax=Citrus sinensis TaxID=2711 RepID=A0A067E4U6_CITSI|nr:hypothetical protein CISIN_1g034927mg [Citrus sinensis]